MPVPTIVLGKNVLFMFYSDIMSDAVLVPRAVLDKVLLLLRWPGKRGAAADHARRHAIRELETAIRAEADPQGAKAHGTPPLD